MPSCGSHVGIRQDEQGCYLLSVDGIAYRICPGSQVSCDPNGLGIVIDGVLCPFPGGSDGEGNVVTSLSFDPDTLILSLEQSEGPSFDVNLDVLASDFYADSVTFDADTRELTVTRTGGLPPLTTVIPSDATELPEGTEGQVIGYGEDGELVAMDLPEPFEPITGTIGEYYGWDEDGEAVAVQEHVYRISLFNPPEVGEDAAPAIQAAVDMAMQSPAYARVVDLEGGTFDVAGPITVPGEMRIRNGTVRATGTREDWAGGTPDSASGVPRQMGIFRAQANSVFFERILLNCGPYTEIPVVTENSVYSEFRPLCNGFEDAYRTGTTKALNLSFRRCRVLDWDDYAYRYSSGSGGGFNLILNTASKTPPQRVGESGRFAVADANLGYSVLLASNDGKVQNCTFFGGEYQIFQASGGTIELNDNHPWCGASAYNRRYFGPAGVPILTGIQVRTETQIFGFDPDLVSVERRETDWQVVVMPLVDIDQADATEVLIRRDEVLAYMRGWGSTWNANYLDGGTVRLGTNGHRHNAGYGLPGAMNTAVDDVPPTMLSQFEFLPNNASAVPPEFIEWNSRSMGGRMLRYPRMNQTSWSALNNRYSDETLMAPQGQNSVVPAIFETIDEDGFVYGFKNHTSLVRLSLAALKGDIVDGVQIITGGGTPNNTVVAPPGSIYLRRQGTPELGTTVYFKEQGVGNTGWVRTVTANADGVMVHKRTDGQTLDTSLVARFMSANGNPTAHIALGNANTPPEQWVRWYNANFYPPVGAIANRGSLWSNRSVENGRPLYIKWNATDWYAVATINTADVLRHMKRTGFEYADGLVAEFKSANGNPTAYLKLSYGEATVDVDEMLIGTGNYSPEGNVAAGRGSLWANYNPAFGAPLWLKTTNGGSDGWIELGSGGDSLPEGTEFDVLTYGEGSAAEAGRIDLRHMVADGTPLTDGTALAPVFLYNNGELVVSGAYPATVVPGEAAIAMYATHSTGGVYSFVLQTESIPRNLWFDATTVVGSTRQLAPVSVEMFRDAIRPLYSAIEAIDPIADPTTATVEDVAVKVNEVIATLKALLP